MSGVIFLLADHLLSLTAVKQKIVRKFITIKSIFQRQVDLRP